MSATFWSAETAGHLERALEMHKQRVRALNRVAEGEEKLSTVDRERLTASEQRIRSLLSELNDGVRNRVRVVEVEEFTASREAVPPALREAYELLYCRVYGSDPAISSGDPAVERGAGKRETRTSTGVEPGRVPGATTGRSRYGQATRNIIKDKKAYQEKLKIDRRLRRIAKDMREFLEGENRMVSRVTRVCSRCGRIGEDDWGFCPHCGFSMVDRTED